MTDVRDILKAVRGAGVSYSQLTAIGTFPTQDKFGNSREEDVLRVTYKRSTVDKINWTGFLTENIYDIADSVWLHRELQ